jgi:hypothetical protein
MRRKDRSGPGIVVTSDVPAGTGDPIATGTFGGAAGGVALQALSDKLESAQRIAVGKRSEEGLKGDLIANTLPDRLQSYGAQFGDAKNEGGSKPPFRCARGVGPGR